MYITIKSLKKTLGKYIELTDVYIGLPLIFIFLILFSFTNLKMFSLIFLTISIFMLLPVSISKKNRMYKVLFMVIKYITRNKEYTYSKGDDIVEKQEKFTRQSK